MIALQGGARQKRGLADLPAQAGPLVSVDRGPHDPVGREACVGLESAAMDILRRINLVPIALLGTAADVPKITRMPDEVAF